MVDTRYSAKKLSKLDFDKKKIKIAFMSPDFKQSHSISYFIKDGCCVCTNFRGIQGFFGPNGGLGYKDSV